MRSCACVCEMKLNVLVCLTVCAYLIVLVYVVQTHIPSKLAKLQHFSPLSLSADVLLRCLCLVRSILPFNTFTYRRTNAQARTAQHSTQDFTAGCALDYIYLRYLFSFLYETFFSLVFFPLHRCNRLTQSNQIFCFIIFGCCSFLCHQPKTGGKSKIAIDFVLDFEGLLDACSNVRFCVCVCNDMRRNGNSCYLNAEN